MQSGVFASPLRRGTWRSKHVFAAAVAPLFIGLAAAAHAQTSGSPLIRIPPAPPPAPTAGASPGAAAPSIAPGQIGPGQIAPTQGTPGKAAPGKTVPAPRALLPADVQVLRDSQGAGLAMFGTLNGQADSAIGVLLAVFVHSQAFDPGAAVRLLLADGADREAQALFTATVHGTPVAGIAVTALTGTGGDITVFYDAADAFTASFLRMRTALTASAGVGTVVMTPLRLADGGAIEVPPGWLVTAEGAGSVTLAGPQGELMSLGATLPVYAAAGGGPHRLHGQCCDPVDAFAAIYPQLAAAARRGGAEDQEPGDILDSAAAAGEAGDKSAFILSDLRSGGDAYQYLARAEAVTGFTDPWTFKLSGVMAPQAIFAAELPTLVRVWKSYSGAGPGLADNVEAALHSMSLTREMLGATVTARQTAQYNAAPLWKEAIATLAQNPNREIDGEWARAFAKRLSADTGRLWRVVAEAEWK